MKIRKIEFQNIFSFGNEKIVIDYDKMGDGSLNMILGKNGCGKSSFIKLHKLALYFEADGVTMDGIANDINGNGFLAIEVDSRGHHWRLESEYTRTKLSSIRVFRDGEEQDWGKIPDTKKMIKSEVIDIPYHIFSNIISLSVNDFKSFLSMSPKDTRNIRDRIFGFYVLNDMMEQVKANMKLYNEKHKSLLSNLQNIEELKRGLEQRIEELTASNGNEERLMSLQMEIDEKQSIIENHKESISELQEKHRRYLSYSNHISNLKLKESISGLEEEVSTINGDIEELSEKISVTQSEIADISDKLLLHIKLKDFLRKTKVLEEIESVMSEKESLEKKLNDNSACIKSVSEEISKGEEITRLLHLVEQEKSLMESISSLSSTIEKDNEEISNLRHLVVGLKQKTEDMEKTLMDFRTRKNVLVSQKAVYESGKCDQCGSDFTDQNSLSKISLFEEEISEIEKSIDSISSEIKISKDNTTSYIDRGKDIKRNIEENTSKMSSLESSLSEVKKSISESNFSIQEAESFVEVDGIHKRYNELVSENSRLTEEIKLLSGKIDVLQDSISGIEDVEIDDVPESEDELRSQSTDKEEYRKELSHLVSSYHDKLSSLRVEIERLKSKIVVDETPFSEDDNLSEDDIDLLKETIDKKNSEIVSLRDSVVELKLEVSTIKISEKSLIEEVKRMIEEHDVKLSTLQEDTKKIHNSIKFYSLLEHVISDDGVKSYIIRNVVPYINKSVNDILSNLEIPLQVKFDDEFKPSIYRFGKQVSINSISTGQTKMIDSAIIFTITKFLISRCGGINIVFYDEIFSSLHQSAISMMMEIIHRELVRDMKLHVFLVNHSFISSSFFNNIVELSMVDHFSRLNIKNVDEYNRQQ